MKTNDIIKAARAQGWRVEQTRKGWMFYPADRSLTGVAWHNTPSDVRAVKNFRAEMVKRGFDWPGGL